MSKKCLVELPDFEILKRQPKVPHVAQIVATGTAPNEYGTPVVYHVRQSRNGKSWWLAASLQGHRASNTLHTTKPDKAAQWVDAVRRGAVCIKRRS